MASTLGAVEHPERRHVPKVSRSRLDEVRQRFGITDDDIRGLFADLERYQVVVIEAPTGSGKSTFLPWRLLVPPDGIPSDRLTRHGQILITQPRVAATTGIPGFVAESLHGSRLGPGFDVGYRHSKSRNTDRRNKLLYTTDGTLINWIADDRLSSFSLIMIDEAHERSLNIDLILGLLCARLPRYPDLRLLIASATIDAGLFIDFFGGADKVAHRRFKGREGANFGYAGPIYWPGAELPVGRWSRAMPDRMVDFIATLLVAIEAGDKAKGDILGFLHAERAIRRACDDLRDRLSGGPLEKLVDVYPLFAGLSERDRDRAIAPARRGRRKVVISTNLAETSLTLEGIVHVVDSGLISQSAWHIDHLTETVEPGIHSKAGCKQRWGRSGRVQRGVAHCLYSEAQFAEFPDYTTPAIQRAPLEAVLLSARAAGVDDLSTFPWIQRPDQRELTRAAAALRARGAVDGDGDITPHGKELSRFASDTDFANLMVVADQFACALEMAVVVAMVQSGLRRVLSWSRDWDSWTRLEVTRRHEALRAPCIDDLELLLAIWHGWAAPGGGEEWAATWCVDHIALRKEVQPAVEKLLHGLETRTKGAARRQVRLDLIDRLRLVMVYGMPDRVYAAVPGTTPRRYRRLSQGHDDSNMDEVEMSATSVLAGYAPDTFVCLARRRRLRRTSPREDPDPITEALAVALVEGNAREVVGLSTMSFARRLRSATRGPDGGLRGEAARRLSPIRRGVVPGSRWTVARGPDGELRLSERLEQPAPVWGTQDLADEDQPSVREISVLEDDPDEDDDCQSSGNADVGGDEPEASPGGPRVEGSSATPDEELADLPLSWPDGFSRSGDPPSVAVIGRVWRRGPGEVEIRADPVTELQFDRFAAATQRGQKRTATIVGIERSPLDDAPLLVVRDDGTGLELPMGPQELSISGRNHSVEQAATRVGDVVTVVIDHLDKRRRRVVVSALESAAQAHECLFGEQSRICVDVVVTEAREDCVWVAVVGTEWPVLMRCSLERTPRGALATSIGATGRAELRRTPTRRWHQTLGKVPRKLAKQAVGKGLGGGVTLGGEQLAVIGPMTTHSRRRLLGYSTAEAYRREIDSLFRLSHRADATLIDLEAFEKLQQRKDQGRPIRVRVVKLVRGGALVETTGGTTGFLAAGETWTGRAAFEEGERLRVIVKQVDPSTGALKLSRKLPSLDPLRRFAEGASVNGTVCRIEDTYALVALGDDVEGLLHVSELGSGRPPTARDRLDIEQAVHARVLSATRDSRGRTSIKLSLNLNLLGCDEPQCTNELGCHEPTFQNRLGCDG